MFLGESLMVLGWVEIIINFMQEANRFLLQKWMTEILFLKSSKMIFCFDFRFWWLTGDRDRNNKVESVWKKIKVECKNAQQQHACKKERREQS